MKLLRINKYILENIFAYLKLSKELNLLRYNKKLQSMLDISIYSYQKKYFESIITPALLNNSEILLQNNIFDKKTLNKLKSDWEMKQLKCFKKKIVFILMKKQISKN